MKHVFKYTYINVSYLMHSKVSLHQSTHLFCSWLKLVRTPLNNLLRGFENYLSLSLCTYITRMDVMLDFICMGPVDLTATRRKRQNTKWKIPCPQWDSNPQPVDSKSDALPTELAGLGECCSFKWPYYIHVLPIPMFTLSYVPEWWSRA